DTILRKIALDPKTLTALPALRRLLQHAEWRGLIRYIGSRDAEPVVWIQSILRHAQDGPPDPQTALHADTFHPTLKALPFLPRPPGGGCSGPASRRRGANLSRCQGRTG